MGALANVCQVTDYAADACPGKSVVGHAQAATPLLPVPLSGLVRLGGNPGNPPKLATTTFASIPDVPRSRFQLDFVVGRTGS